MFTEGLDESAINWIKKGSDVEQCQIRSPLTEKLDTKYPLPRSPLAYSSSNFTSSHVLPPLKFHSGLLKPINTVALSVDSDEDESDYYNDDESESVGSAPDEISRNHSDDDTVDRPVIRGFEEDMIYVNSSKNLNDRKHVSTINRGPLKEGLRVEVPGSVRRFTDGEWGSRGCGPTSAVSVGSCRMYEKNQPHSADPSAPPFMDISNVQDSEVGSEKITDVQYKESDQGLSGDKVFSEQSQRSLRTETEVGGRLHKLLLQPRGVQQADRDNKVTEQTMASKVKRTVGKIRVEVKKLRIIPRRKLKNTNSMRGAIYLQAGAEYVRHVSSIVKHRINSLKLSSLSFPCEESLLCMIHLKSLAEDNEVEPSSAISLRPGTGEYHDFFPESQGDALLLEVQDAMKNVQGCATVPVSSLTDNHNDRVRWWPIYHNDNECVGKILLSIGSTFTSDETVLMKKSILMDCETQVERLLAEVFQNYKSLDEKSPTGLADMSAPISETAAPALAPAVQLYTLLHDILAQDAQTTLRNYLQTAATKRCRKHMLETDEFVSSNSEGFIMDSDTISKAYLKMKNLCINISNEIHIDIKIHNQHIFPSSIDLSTITSAVYSTELSKRLGGFLAAWPPSSPMPHVNELLIAMSDFERSLELWNISPVQGGVNSRDLYHGYIMVWIQDLQLTLLDLCKAEKLGIFLNTMKRILDVLHCRIEDKLKSWASYLPINGDNKSTFGEQMNATTVLLRTKYKNYIQAIVVKLASNILDDVYASQMQRLLGNALQEKDLEPPRSITEARSILSRDTTNRMDSSSYIYF
ncbi:UNVERIFIED_CONTAM: hypothetical protein Slati_2095800 [Sesamum latifolium]|uniref:Uncharacterized protein n=1 Tax=Sesamum latifolium TaxID=2727402 RepID=A0AAW2WSR1_9LAMI